MTSAIAPESEFAPMFERREPCSTPSCLFARFSSYLSLNLPSVPRKEPGLHSNIDTSDTSMPGTAARDEHLTDTHRHAKDKRVSFKLMVTLKLLELLIVL